MLDLDETIEEYECCDTLPPKKMTFGYSQFGGMYLAKCGKCSYTCAYWECACELSHDCKGE
jgi:hypothetical protein